MSLQKILNTTTANPKSLFLIDGLGALLSAFLLGVVLVKLESTFGMPKRELYYLSFAALVFATYDFVCYFGIRKNWRPFLKIIAITNLIYCFVSLALVFYFHQALTILGFIYFFLEIIIILIIVSIELKTIARFTSSKIK